MDEAFDVPPYAKQVEHLQRSRKVLKTFPVRRSFLFRAPALRVNEHTPRALAEAGYAPTVPWLPNASTCFCRSAA